jgi:hypothetical protein
MKKEQISVVLGIGKKITDGYLIPCRLILELPLEINNKIAEILKELSTEELDKCVVAKTDWGYNKIKAK